MKRYLTGVDWVVNAIDYTSKAQSGIGNHSEIILELNNSLSHKALTETLNNFIQKFSCLNGFPSRAINLCPYWKVQPRRKIPPVRLQFIKLNSDSEYLLPMAAQVNTEFTNKREHLAFALIETDKKTFLTMTFDHRILDAKGAEAFLELFQQHNQNILHPPQISFKYPSNLNRWKEKLSSGRKINRFLLDFSKESPKILPLNPQNEPCKFKVIHLDPKQSDQLKDIAYAHAGYLMFMPYALAKCIQIMHKIFQEKNIPGETYLIPVPIDTRIKEESQKEAFFNHFSFFLFKIQAHKVDNLSDLIGEIKNQMYAQVKNKIPEAIINASFLMRIAGLPLTNFFLKLMSKKHFASFSFSYLNNANQPNRFMQEQLLNIFHLPRTPKPPGVGIFFNQFEDKLNITLSYFDDLLNDSQANQIINNLKVLCNES